MAFEILEATKEQARLRMGIAGPGGSGKTYTMLGILTEMADGDSSAVGVIDTEHGSASKYGSGQPFRFKTLRLDPPYSPDRYIEAIAAMEGAGIKALGIDSASHGWSGTGGVLEIVDQIAKRSKSGSSFNAWRDASPQQHRLVEKILASPCHIIMSMRTKTEWVLEQGQSGKTSPKRVGLAPVQRDDLIFELDVFGEMDLDHNLIITKSRCPEVADKVYNKPGRDVAKALKAWLSDGAIAPPPSPKPEPGVYALAQAAFKDSGLTVAEWKACAEEAMGVAKRGQDWTAEDLQKVQAAVKARKEKAA